MTTLMDAVVLTVRGTLVPTTLEAARTLHNETAGSEPGILAARALGDLSHKVYAPSIRAGKMSNAKEGELLFLDTWKNAAGIQQFFSNPHVQDQAGRMFSSRDATLWMPARGAFSFHLPSAMGKNERYVGLLRAAGIDASVALLSAWPAPEVSPSLPALSGFNHVMTGASQREADHLPHRR